MTPPEPRPLRVLHVVESYGGGVASALHDYVRAVPEAEHHLVRAVRPGTWVAGNEDAFYASVSDLPARSPVKAMRTIREEALRKHVDLVHAHSSFAGGLTRLAVRSTRFPVVYTPHCFAFERLDVSWAARLAYRSVENILSLNTTVLAGCSRHETACGQRMIGHPHAVYVPNIAEGVQPHHVNVPEAEIDVVGVGRLGPQKAPHWFAEAVDQLQASFPRRIRATWVGGGEGPAEAELRSRGIEVTGWVSRADATRLVAGARAYLHTAAWEGAPMSILEAVALGVPTVVRQIPSLDEVPAAAAARTPADAAGILRMLLDPSSDFGTEVLREWRTTFRSNTASEQRAALLHAYELATMAHGPGERHRTR